MKILVTGFSGMLGIDLVSELLPYHDVCGIENRETDKVKIRFQCIDITNRNAVFKVIGKFKPQVIIHTAAHVDADDCEKNPDHAYSINTQGTKWIADASVQEKATLLFISSDYVFDGMKQDAYDETDQPNPRNVYGKSKMLAENYLCEFNIGAYIIRPCWLFGENGPNFFRAILRKVARNENLKVVDDQIGAPTYTKDLSKVLRTIAEKAVAKNLKSGIQIYHVANNGKTSWFSAAKLIVSKVNSQVKLDPIPSTQLDRAAKRPNNSVFNMSKIKNDFGIVTRPWNEALEDYWNQSLKREWKQLVKSA